MEEVKKSVDILSVSQSIRLTKNHPVPTPARAGAPTYKTVLNTFIISRETSTAEQRPPLGPPRHTDTYHVTTCPGKINISQGSLSVVPWSRRYGEDVRVCLSVQVFGRKA
ncbi:hypothetical protein SFRURICE_010290 [Spodoptera frugiperda]|nr:hypothetical protein SFRURICE_010290 [Spodoptera frugiperda]